MFNGFKGFKALSLAIVLIIALTVSGCGGGGKSGGDATRSASLSTKLSGVSGSVSKNMRSASLSASAIPFSVDGIYFGDIEIVGYQYAPNQNNEAYHYSSCGFLGKDWRYNVNMAGGQMFTRDTVLKSGQLLDVNAIRGPYQSLPASGTFQADIFEVFITATAFITGNNVYGAIWETEPLVKKYPEYAALAMHTCLPQIPGLVEPQVGENEKSEVNIFFARDDWFPEPVYVNVVGNNVDQPCTINRSSKPLTDFQAVIINSLCAQGTARRPYGNIIIVPYKCAVVDQQTLFTVGFNLAGLVDFNKTDLNTPAVYYNCSEDQVPFGVTLTVQQPLPPTPPTTVDPGTVVAQQSKYLKR